MFYYLPNKQPIDIEGAIDAMLDDNPTSRYFLDTVTGNTGCIETRDDEGRQALQAIEQDGNRYCELPRVSEDVQIRWMESFVYDCISPEDPAFGAVLAEALRESGFRKALNILETSKVDSGWSWRGWAGDSAFEELGLWLRKNVLGVMYELRGCEDCAICRAAKNGGGLQELRDAFDEQKNIDNDV